MFYETKPVWGDGVLHLVGAAVRESRHRLGVSQRELAHRARLSQSTISRVEHGLNRTLKLQSFARLIVVLAWVGTEAERASAMREPDAPSWFRPSIDPWTPLDRRRRRGTAAS